jgi:hypothetical protein
VSRAKPFDTLSASRPGFVAFARWTPEVDEVRVKSETLKSFSVFGPRWGMGPPDNYRVLKSTQNEAVFYTRNEAVEYIIDRLEKRVRGLECALDTAQTLLDQWRGERS